MLMISPSPSSSVARFVSYAILLLFQYRPKCSQREMAYKNLNTSDRRQANLRLCNISSNTTEVLEISAENPAVHILFIPGNPGVITFYKDVVEFLYELLDGSASITAIGHISHTRKSWEHGKLFSLEDQIKHKIDFIKQELLNTEVPRVLVGHSIGSYISIEMFRRHPEKVLYCIGLYPFLALDVKSHQQSIIGKLAASSTISTGLSYMGALLGSLPRRASTFLVKQTIGRSWSATATEAACTHLFQYHTLRNVLYMAMTEFKEFAVIRAVDWTFIREKQNQMAFLFGIDDHWGPLSLHEEISKHATNVKLSIEREGHTHSFCCTEAGSLWVARHVANIIKNQV